MNINLKNSYFPIIALSFAFLILNISMYAQAYLNEGNVEIVDGKLTIDHPTTVAGDVPLIIDASGSSFFTGLKMTYGANTTYIFSRNSATGGIEVTNGNINFAPVYASEFVDQVPRGTGQEKAYSMTDLNALGKIRKIKSQFYKSNDKAGHPILNLDINTLPDDIVMTSSTSPGGSPINDVSKMTKGVKLSNWLALITQGIQELDQKTRSSSDYKKIIEEQERTINGQAQQIASLLEQLGKIEVRMNEMQSKTDGDSH